MKQKISGPAAVAVIVIVSIAIIGFLYTQNFHEKKISPEEVQKAMSQHMGGDSKGH